MPEGTEVVANPTLAGTESELTGLQVGSTKYKIGSGRGHKVVIYLRSDFEDDISVRYTTPEYKEERVDLQHGRNVLENVAIINEISTGGGYYLDEFQGYVYFNGTFAEFDPSEWQNDYEKGLIVTDLEFSIN